MEIMPLIIIELLALMITLHDVTAIHDHDTAMTPGATTEYFMPFGLETTSDVQGCVTYDENFGPFDAPGFAFFGQTYDEIYVSMLHMDVFSIHRIATSIFHNNQFF